MFIVTKKFTRGKALLSVLLLGAVLAGLVLLAGSCQRREETRRAVQNARANEDRVAYLATLGWEVEKEALETLHLHLPDALEGSEYEAYNALQLQQGFDLTPYCGQQVTRYTYTLTNYPARPSGVQVNLYCCEGTVIAGDVIAMGEDGFQGTLAFPKSE